MDLKEKDIKLVERCIIEKWEPLTNGCEESWRYDSLCPLCNVYWVNYCLSCPIYKETGKHRCHGTPLKKIYALEENIEGVDGYKDVTDPISATESPLFWGFVEEMVEFLIGMLPEDHEWRKI